MTSANKQNDPMIESFLAGTEWDGWAITDLSGDASNRSYKRLIHPTDARTVVLMIAPPEKGKSVVEFLTIGAHLHAVGLSAPKIMKCDDSAGLMVLEDLGDDLFAKVVANNPKQERPLYQAAVDVLVQLQSVAPPPNTAAYGVPIMTKLAALAFDWYLFGCTGQHTHDAKEHFQHKFSAMLQSLPQHNLVLILRDYHAENLIWLPHRTGAKKVGLLDFQDAMIGSPAYDLVSLLEDARRDVSPAVQHEMQQHFMKHSGMDEAAFHREYAIMGAQRNVRIVGVFARLSLYYGKPHYVNYLPRVWENLMRNLSHPDLAEVKETVLAHLPEPTPDILETLKNKCATVHSL